MSALKLPESNEHNTPQIHPRRKTEVGSLLSAVRLWTGPHTIWTGRWRGPAICHAHPDFSSPWNTCSTQCERQTRLASYADRVL